MSAGSFPEWWLVIELTIWVCVHVCEYVYNLTWMFEHLEFSIKSLQIEWSCDWHVLKRGVWLKIPLWGIFLGRHTYGRSQSSQKSERIWNINTPPEHCLLLDPCMYAGKDIFFLYLGRHKLQQYATINNALHYLGYICTVWCYIILREFIIQVTPSPAHFVSSPTPLLRHRLGFGAFQSRGWKKNGRKNLVYF